jgi:hypothetical protein
MAAMNISLTDDLRVRMESVSGVTWSQVAAKAFELEVNSRTMGKDNDDMTAAIKRLKASRQKAEQEDRASGLEDGKQWAMEDADWVDLDAIAKMEGNTYDDLQEALSDWCSDINEEVFGREGPQASDAYVGGFIEGAMLVHRAVLQSGPDDEAA